MYTNPQAKVYFNGQYSDLFNIERGVAQGCKLSTLLFNLYINDLLNKLSSIKSDYIQLTQLHFAMLMTL